MIKSFYTTLLEQKDRWILWVPMPLAMGIGGYFSLSFEPPLYLGGLFSAILIIGIIPFCRSRILVLLWLPFFLVALGFSAAQFRTWCVQEPVLYKKTHGALTLEGRVAAVETMENAYRITLDGITYSSLPQNPMPERVRVTSRIHDDPPMAGDVISLSAVLLPLSLPAEPGAYDFQRKAFFDGLGATGYAVSAIERIKPSGQGDFLFPALRHYIHAHIDAQIEDKDTAAVAAGMLVGESKGISGAAWNDIRLSGLAHLLAIAGLHMGVMTGWLFFLTRFLLASVPYVALRWPVKKISAGISAAGAIFYLCLVGFFLPAERAVIMICVAMTAIIFDRDPFSLRLLAFASVILLLFRPENLIGVSFQMSFAAVTVLIAFYESTREWWARLSRDKRWFMRIPLFVLGSAATTGAATLGTAPYSLFHFSRVPFISGFVANLIAVPIAVVDVLPIGVVSCLLMPFGLEAWPLKVVGWGVSAILKTAEITAHWPYAAWHAGGWPVSILNLISFGGLWTCIWRGKIRWIGLVPVMFALALIPMREKPDVLIGGNFKLLAAVRDGEDRLWLSAGRNDSFTRDSWVDREGESGAATWPDSGEAGGGFLSCDERACVYRMKSSIVLFIRDSSAASEDDCNTADIVVTPRAKKPYFPCRATVIDKWAVYDYGVHAIYLTEGKPPRIVNVTNKRGRRPWTGRVYAPKAWRGDSY